MKIEVSNGEIVDKFTILEIKLRNSDSDQKSKQIAKEMMYLSPIVEELNVPSELIDGLRDVNHEPPHDAPLSYVLHDVNLCAPRDVRHV